MTKQIMASLPGALAVKVAVAIVVILGGSATADAQIFTWREADGVLVVSDTSRTPDLTAVAVRGATAIRATRAARPPNGRDFSAIILRAATRPDTRRGRSWYGPSFRSNRRSIRERDRPWAPWD